MKQHALVEARKIDRVMGFHVQHCSIYPSLYQCNGVGAKVGKPASPHCAAVAAGLANFGSDPKVRIFRKTGVRDRVELVNLFRQPPTS